MTLTTGQAVPEYPQYRVLAGGNYQPADLVDVEHVDRPGVAEVAFQANYIATGENL